MHALRCLSFQNLCHSRCAAEESGLRRSSLAPLSYPVTLYIILISQGESGLSSCGETNNGANPVFCFRTWCLPLLFPSCVMGAELHEGRGAAASRGPSGYYAHEGLLPVASSCSVCRSSSETPHGRNLFLPFHCGGVGGGC